MGTTKILFSVIIFSAFIANAQIIDFSRAPNSYIFDINFARENAKGGIIIPVRKAYEVWSSNEYLTDEGINTPIPQGQASASLYWEDVLGLIRSVELMGSGENAQIKVMIDSSKGKGNALVAFKVEGEVYWSWHIWVTDDPSDGVVYAQGYETDIDGIRFDPKYMDRNLGAQNNHFLGDDWHKSTGLMYQWGRKDPFPALVHKDFTFYELNGEDIGTVRHKDAIELTHSTKFRDDFLRPYDEIEKNIRFSVQNPLLYISNTDDDPYTEPNGGNGTWFSRQQYRNATTAWDLWGDNYRGGMGNASSSNTTLANDSRSYELKSPFDPCPNGWRIPSYYGRITLNNNHSPWGRRNSGGNDGANPLYTNLYTNSYNPVLDGIKVYQGLGLDFTEIPNRNLGVIPNTGNFEYYPNEVSNSSIPHTEYQDESADGGLWSATYSQGGARQLRYAADNYKDPNQIGGHFVNANSAVVRPKEAYAVRCMQDPNLHKIGSFETEYVDSEVIDYLEGIDNPNSYLVTSGQTVVEIPVNKAFSIYNQYLSDHEMLPENDLRTKVFWTTNPELIQNVSIVPDDSNLSDAKSAKIIVELNPGQTGNAVVSLHNEDVSNPVYWSWHIWVPSEEINRISYTTEEIIPAPYNFVNLVNSRNFPLKTTFMDRNLGALNAFPNADDPDLENKITHSGGLYYQWGRKDPIPTFLSPGNESYSIYIGNNSNGLGEVTYEELDLNNYNTEFTSEYADYSQIANPTIEIGKDLKHKNIIKFSSENPLTYLYHDQSGTQDWLSDELGYEQERWGHGGEKSPFDPCPAGWRVPDMSFVYSQYRGSSPWFNGKKTSAQQANPHYLGSNYGGIPVMEGNVVLGWNFPDPLFRVGNYPATGIRINGNTISGITYQTALWTSAVSMRQQSNAFAFRVQREASGDNFVTAGGGFSPQMGMNVRCAVDEPRYTGEQICPSTIWDGNSWSDGIPDFSKKVIINGELILSSNLEACELEVADSGYLEIPSGFSFTVKGIVINYNPPENLIVRSGANLIQIDEDIVNIGKITIQRENQPFKRLDYTMWSSPVQGQQLQAFSPNTLPNRITTYEGDLGYVMVENVDQDFLEGKGYMFRAPNNWSTEPTTFLGEFTGVPNNGDVDISTYSGGFTSIGNPYPSNLNVDLLMNENFDISTLYFWNNTGVPGNNYATYTIIGGTSAGGGSEIPNGILSVGQGFIVRTFSDSVKFDNSMRTSDDEIFFRTNEDDKNRLWLDLSDENNAKYNQILVAYVDGATQGVDHRIDGGQFGIDGSALYCIIQGEKFTIQGRGLPFEDSDIVKLGFKAEQAGKFKISVAGFDGFFAQEDFKYYLKDNQLGLYHPLSEADYTFESSAGVFDERFELVYEIESLMETEDLTDDLIQIYTDNQYIFIKSDFDKIISAELYDLSGKLIHINQNVNDYFYQIKSISKGVFLLKIKTLNGEIFLRKLII